MAAANADRLIAELTVEISRNGRQGLVEGTEAVLAGVDGVHEVADVRVHRIRPDLNALSAEVTVDLVVDAADERDLADALGERYAVRAVRDIDRG
ncbi:hypothetical protein [Halocalculus aciditolerans]|uniref:Uncharacterized protein n=1 Tax=Halocalculus aciditolerans TaxID=1383812 RepID=A0A830F3C8_9EURY|nr:hypothetical protein [Halocalculus aciditolerans]GGL58951.1 hypothetical protein GCM10009039_16480 [Halocalculus aciditolerans]